MDLAFIVLCFSKSCLTGFLVSGLSFNHRFLRYSFFFSSKTDLTFVFIGFRIPTPGGVEKRNTRKEKTRTNMMTLELMKHLSSVGLYIMLGFSASFTSDLINFHPGGYRYFLDGLPFQQRKLLGGTRLVVYLTCFQF